MPLAARLSSISEELLEVRAWASDSQPASRIRLWRKTSRRSVLFLVRQNASDRAPSGPMSLYVKSSCDNQRSILWLYIYQLWAKPTSKRSTPFLKCAVHESRDRLIASSRLYRPSSHLECTLCIVFCLVGNEWCSRSLITWPILDQLRSVLVLATKLQSYRYLIMATLFPSKTR